MGKPFQRIGKWWRNCAEFVKRHHKFNLLQVFCTEVGCDALENLSDLRKVVVLEWVFVIEGHGVVTEPDNLLHLLGIKTAAQACVGEGKVLLRAESVLAEHERPVHIQENNPCLFEMLESGSSFSHS